MKLYSQVFFVQSIPMTGTFMNNKYFNYQVCATNVFFFYFQFLVIKEKQMQKFSHNIRLAASNTMFFNLETFSLGRCVKAG